MADKVKKVFRDPDNKVVFGLLGGLGEYFKIDPVLLRLSFVLVVVLTGFFPGVIFYIIGAFITPQKS